MKKLHLVRRAACSIVESLETRRMLTAYIPQTGSPFEAYSDSSAAQIRVDMAYRNGRGVLTWSDFGVPLGNDREVMARIFDDKGEFVGPAFQVNTNIASMQGHSTAGVAADGSFVIGWYDGSANAVVFQRYDSDASPIGGEISLAESDFAQMGGIAVAGDGSFIVTYARWGGGSPDIAAQRFDNTGSPIGGKFTVNTTTANWQNEPSVAINSNGNFIIAWYGEGNGDVAGVFMQRYDSSGNPIGSETLVNTTTANDQTASDIVSLSDDSFVITWHGEGGGDTEGIFFQRYDASGSPLGSETLANTATTGSQRYSSITAGADGRFVIGWNNLNSTQATARVFNSDGSTDSDEVIGPAGAANEPVGIAVTEDGYLALSYQRNTDSHVLMASFVPVLTIDGTSGNDTITIADDSGELAVTINGVTTNHATFSPYVVINGGAGDDTITVSSLPAGVDAVTINGEAGADSIVGSDGDDSISGGDDNDTLDGGEGSDTLIGDGGDDMVSYATRTNAVSVDLSGDQDDGEAGENDLVDTSVDGIIGGAGNDTLDGSNATSSVTLWGNNGNDVLTGGSSDDSIDGGAGDDTLVGGDMGDLLLGGDDEDSISGGNGDDTIDGGLGADELSGGDDADTITYTSRTTDINITLDGVANDGASGEGDNIDQTVDRLLGGSGNDTLDASDVNSSVTLRGNDGNDILTGGSSNDSIDGGVGDDTLDGGAGADHLEGGDDEDTVTYASRSSGVSVVLDGDDEDGEAGENDNVQNDVETIVGGGGNDTLTASNAGHVLLGGAGNDSLTGGTGSDVLNGEAGNDVLDGGMGSDEMNGGSDSDTVTYASRTADLHVVLDNQAGDGENGENDKVGTDVEVVFGGSGHDTLEASDAGHSLFGRAGNDSLVGGAGADALRGEAGNDTLIGGGERDRLIGGSDADLIEGGDGPDILYGQEGDDSIFGGKGRERVWAGEGNDRIKGDHHDDTLCGEDGDDRIYGDHGNDQIEGGEGQNYLQGGIGNDSLIGGSAYDKLFGEEGNDTLNGGAGSDRVDGGAENDAAVNDLLDKLLGIEALL